MGVREPEATFYVYFGSTFMIWNPKIYAELLAKRIQQYVINIWLVNTGWSGGFYGEIERMSLEYTRSIIDTILDGTLKKAPSEHNDLFGFDVPTEFSKVPNEIMMPRNIWSDGNACDKVALKLASIIQENFK